MSDHSSYCDVACTAAEAFAIAKYAEISSVATSNVLLPAQSAPAMMLDSAYFILVGTTMAF